MAIHPQTHQPFKSHPFLVLGAIALVAAGLFTATRYDWSGGDAEPGLATGTNPYPLRASVPAQVVMTELEATMEHEAAMAAAYGAAETAPTESTVVAENYDAIHNVLGGSLAPAVGRAPNSLPASEVDTVTLSEADVIAEHEAAINGVLGAPAASAPLSRVEPELWFDDMPVP